MASECYMCSKFRCSTNTTLVKHLFEVHSYEPSFMYACQIDNCPRAFMLGSTYSSFISHASRKHPNWRKTLDNAPPIKRLLPLIPMETVATEPSESSGEEIPSNTEPLEDLERMDYSADMPGEQYDDTDLSDGQKAAARFLLTLKERYRLSQVAVDFAVGAVKQIVSIIYENVKKSVTQSLEEKGLDIPTHELEGLFTPIDIFEGLETEYQQTKFYRDHFGLVEPETIELGKTYCWQKSGNRNKLVEKKDTFQYVPLLDSLASLMQNKDVYNEISKSHQRDDNLLEDFYDGSLLKSHPVFKDDHTALQLIAYYDDVELFFSTLWAKKRSTLKCIQLIACATYPNLEKYGFQKILQPFINDANKLSSGVHLCLNGRDVLVKGAVISLLADTQAAHSIGGFKIGVGFAFRKCRNCLATKEMMSTLFREADFVPRTEENYEYHCSLLDGPLSESDSVTYGINYSSPLNELTGFHVANGQLPQDVMHLLLEGVLPYEIRLMLTEFITVKKYFALEYLNDRVKSFTYSPDEAKDKPPPIKSSDLTNGKKISMAAVEMWVFAVYLPLMIGHKVPENDEMWECYLLLLDILKLCTSRVQSPDLVAFLEVLISDHHHSFAHCYPGSSITPKLHYCIHLPSQILRIGPLTSSWCLRMEAKNSYFKRIAQIGNFKNIALSVAKRHQCLACAYLQSTTFFSDFQAGPCKEPVQLSRESLHVQDLVARKLTGISGTTLVYRSTWLQYEGNTYQEGMFVLIGWQDDDLPQFGEITDLLAITSTHLMAVKVYSTEGLDRHVHSYVIQSTDRLNLISLCELSVYPPTVCHSVHRLYVTTKSNLIKC